MLHDCRQLVSWDAGVSPAPSATLILSCQHLVGHSEETAGDKPEEGGDDVKSSWPLRAALHTCYNGGDSGKPGGHVEPIPKSRLRAGRSLLLGCVKMGWLVIADVHAVVKTFAGLVHTAGHTMGVGYTLSRCAKPQGM